MLDLVPTDANDVVTSFDYDHFGRLLRVNYPGGGPLVNRLGQEIRRELRNLDAIFSVAGGSP